jgi:hypothetical protein
MKTIRIIVLMFLWLTSVEKYATSAPAPDPRAALEAPGSSNLISDWINVHLKTIRNTRILTHFLGDKVSFTDNTYAYRGYKPHHFNSILEAGREAGMSRLYGGIHYRPSIEAGYKQGEKVADNIARALVFKN